MPLLSPGHAGRPPPPMPAAERCCAGAPAPGRGWAPRAALICGLAHGAGTVAGSTPPFQSCAQKALPPPRWHLLHLLGGVHRHVCPAVNMGQEGRKGQWREGSLWGNGFCSFWRLLYCVVVQTI